MEQITRRDGRFYYGQKMCVDAGDAYRHFRNDYNASVGRVAYRRLNRIGSRKDRIRDIGFVLSKRPECPIDNTAAVPVMLMGLLAGCYCKTIDGWNIPSGVTEDNFEEWINWVFCRGYKHYKLVGLGYKAGRTGKILRKRYN